MPIMSTTNWLNYYSTTSAGITASVPYNMTLLYVETFGTWFVNGNPVGNIHSFLVQVFS